MKITDPNNTYFTSDLHLGHRAQVAARGFASISFDEFRNRGADVTAREAVTDTEVADHDDRIFGLINRTVPVDATLFILGDFTMHAKAAVVAEYLADVECNEVHLIQGNHDDWKSLTDAGFASIRSMSTISNRMNKKTTRMVACHYPIRVWDGCGDGAIHIHGHSHGSLDNPGLGYKAFDVGINTNEFGKQGLFQAPLSFTEIAEAAELRTEFPAYDHHAK